MVLTIVLIVIIIILLALMFLVGVFIDREILPRLAPIFQRDLALYIGGLIVMGIIIGLLSAKIFMS